MGGEREVQKRGDICIPRKGNGHLLQYSCLENSHGEEQVPPNKSRAALGGFLGCLLPSQFHVAHLEFQGNPPGVP